MTNEVIFTPSIRLRYFPLWVGIGSRTGKVDTGSYFASRCGSQSTRKTILCSSGRFTAPSS